MADKLRTFQGAVAIITGGASGIGKALADALTAKGAEVVLADLQLDRAQEAAAALETQGARATAVGIDVTDFRAMEALVQETSRTICPRRG